ncbi:hypothetical protein [Antarctobacter heliothermus]|uniref:Thioredoxin domain-containing protein n=1 Tax=Antarctobacter heliothermus TaxID=74033 RepID=A0A239ECL8_9RHOB|nr:hypothetical protein [Antarctobacter heliothermus]SNS42425.1 hypothetical protein SAMN04488078_101468 [Antarctobacter heliothermus]
MNPYHARRLLLVAAFSCFSGPLGADDGPLPAGDGGLQAEFLGRLRALEAPAAPIDLYTDERQADLTGIARQESLFDPKSPGFGPKGTPAIALLIGPDCPDCATALTDLWQISKDLGIRVAVLDTANPDHAATMAALGLDILPSYVMHDRMIRGHMPAFVLHRYLTDAGG